MEIINNLSDLLQPAICQRCSCIEVAASAAEVALDDLRRGDLLLIQTANST